MSISLRLTILTNLVILLTVLQCAVPPAASQTAVSISSLIATGHGSTDPVFSNGDTITITFDRNTNRPPVYTKELIDVLLTGSVGSSLGLDYTGEWADARTLVITITNSTVPSALTPPAVGQWKADFSRQAALDAAAATNPFIVDNFDTPGALGQAGWTMPSWPLQLGVLPAVVSSDKRVCATTSMAGGMRPEDFASTPSGMRATMDFTFSNLASAQSLFVLQPANPTAYNAVIAGVLPGESGFPHIRIITPVSQNGVTPIATQSSGSGRFSTLSPGTTYTMVLEFNQHDTIRFNIKDSAGFMLDDWVEAAAPGFWNNVGFSVGPGATNCIDHFTLSTIKQGSVAYGTILRDSLKVPTWSGGASLVSSAWSSPVPNFAYPVLTTSGACATNASVLGISDPTQGGAIVGKGEYRGWFLFKTPSLSTAYFSTSFVLSDSASNVITASFTRNFTDNGVSIAIALPQLSNRIVAQAFVPFTDPRVKFGFDYKVLVSWSTVSNSISVSVFEVLTGLALAPPISASLSFVPRQAGFLINRADVSESCVHDFAVETGPYLTDELETLTPLTSMPSSYSASAPLSGSWAAAAPTWPAEGVVFSNSQNWTTYGSSLPFTFNFTAAAVSAMSTCDITADSGKFNVVDSPIGSTTSIPGISPSSVSAGGNSFRVFYFHRTGTPPFTAVLRVTCHMAQLQDAYSAQFTVTIRSAPEPLHVVSAVASGVNSDLTYSNGDKITLTFDKKTNQPPVNTKESIDALLTGPTGSSMGLQYAGIWTDARTLQITIANSTMPVGRSAPAIGQWKADFSRESASAAAAIDPAPFIVEDFNTAGGTLEQIGWTLPTWAEQFGMQPGVISSDKRVCAGALQYSAMRPEDLANTPSGMRATMDFTFTDFVNAETFFVLEPNNPTEFNSVVAGLNGEDSGPPRIRISTVFPQNGIYPIYTHSSGSGRFSTLSPGTTYTMVLEFNQHDTIRFNIKDSAGFMLDDWVEAAAPGFWRHVGFAVGRKPGTATCIDHFTLATIDHQADAYATILRDSLMINTWSGGSSGVSPIWLSPVQNFVYPSITSEGACATSATMYAALDPATSSVRIGSGEYRAWYLTKIASTSSGFFSSSMVLASAQGVVTASFARKVTSTTDGVEIKLALPQQGNAVIASSFLPLPDSRINFGATYKVLVRWSSSTKAVSVSVIEIATGLALGSPVTGTISFVPQQIGFLVNKPDVDLRSCVHDFMLEAIPLLTDEAESAVPITSLPPSTAISPALSGSWGTSNPTWPSTGVITSSSQNWTTYGSSLSFTFTFSADAVSAMSTCDITADSGKLSVVDSAGSASSSISGISSATVTAAGGSFHVFYFHSTGTPPFTAVLRVTCHMAQLQDAYSAQFTVTIRPVVDTSSLQIISAVASGGNTNTVFSTGDKITINFNKNTNLPPVHTKELVDALLTGPTGSSMGLHYAGEWTDSRTLSITVANSTVPIGRSSPVIGQWKADFSRQTGVAAAALAPAPFAVEDFNMAGGTVLQLGWTVPSWAAAFNVAAGVISSDGRVCATDVQYVGIRPEDLANTPSGMRATMDFSYTDVLNAETFFVLQPANPTQSNSVLAGLNLNKNGPGSEKPEIRISTATGSPITRSSGTGRFSTLSPGTTYTLVLEFNQHDTIRFNIKDSAGFMLDDWVEAAVPGFWRSIGFVVGRIASTASCIDHFTLATIDHQTDGYGTLLRDSLKLPTWSGGSSGVSADWISPVSNFVYPSITTEGACATSASSASVYAALNPVAGALIGHGEYRAWYLTKIASTSSGFFSSSMVLASADGVVTASFARKFNSTADGVEIKLALPQQPNSVISSTFLAVPNARITFGTDYKVLVRWSSYSNSVSVSVIEVASGLSITTPVTGTISFVPQQVGFLINRPDVDASSCLRDFAVEMVPYLTDMAELSVPLTSLSPPASVSPALSGSWGTQPTSWPSTGVVTSSSRNWTTYGLSLPFTFTFSADAVSAMSTCDFSATSGAIGTVDSKASAQPSITGVSSSTVSAAGNSFRVFYFHRTDTPPFTAVLRVTCHMAQLQDAYSAQFTVTTRVPPQLTVSLPSQISVDFFGSTAIGSAVAISGPADRMASLFVSVLPTTAGSLFFSNQFNLTDKVICAPACSSTATLFNVSGLLGDLSAAMQFLRFYSAVNAPSTLSVKVTLPTASPPATTAHTVLTPVCSSSAPAVNTTSATVRMTGNNIVVTFDTDVVNTVSAAAVFPCSLLFTVSTGSGNIDTELGVGSFCYSSSNSITLVSGSGASITPSSVLSLKAGIRRCPVGADVSGPLPTTVATHLIPSVFLSAPSTVGSCDSGEVAVIAFVTNLGGRPPLNVQWTLNGSPASHDPTSPLILHLPLSALTAGASNAITLSLQNFLGFSPSSPASVSVFKLQDEAPTVTIIGPSTAVPARSPIVLFASASSCGSDNAAGLSFSWIVPAGLTGITGTNAQFLRIPSRAISAGSTQVFICNVTDSLGHKGQASFSVSVARSPLFAFISNGLSTTASTATDYTLDGSKSRDPDVDSDQGLAYLWSCVDSDGAACKDSDGVALTFSSAATTTLPTSRMPIGSVLINLTITKDIRTSTALQQVTISPGSAPRAPIVSLGPSVISPSQTVRLVTFVEGGVQPYSIKWSEASGRLDLSSFNTTGRFLVVAGVFSPGATYTFQVLVTDSAGQSASSSLSVTVNAPPTSGTFSVSPLVGTALNTSFTLSAPNWADADNPLLYQFFRIDSATKARVPLTAFPSTTSTLSVSLPAGLPSNGYNMTVGVRVIDALGAEALPLPVQTIAVGVPAAIESSITQALAQLNGASSDVFSQVEIVNAVVGTLNSGAASEATAEEARRQVLQTLTDLSSGLSADVLAQSLPAIVSNPSQVDFAMIQQSASLVPTIFSVTNLQDIQPEEVLALGQSVTRALVNMLDAFNYLLLSQSSPSTVHSSTFRTIQLSDTELESAPTQSPTNADVFSNIWTPLYLAMSTLSSRSTTVPGDISVFADEPSMTAHLVRAQIGGLSDFTTMNATFGWSNPLISFAPFTQSGSNSLDARYIFARTNPFLQSQPGTARSGVASVNLLFSNGTVYSGQLASGSAPLTIKFNTECVGSCSPVCYALNEATFQWYRESVSTTVETNGVVTCGASQGGSFAVFEATTPESHDSSDLSTGAIVGIAVGCGTFFLVMTTLVFLRAKKQMDQEAAAVKSNQGVTGTASAVELPVVHVNEGTSSVIMDVTSN